MTNIIAASICSIECFFTSCKGEEYNFKKIINGGTDDLGVPYDFNSLMHYGPTDFAKGPGLNTITSLDGSTNFGDAAVLSPKDIEQARLMYCPGTTGKCDGIPVEYCLLKFLNKSVHPQLLIAKELNSCYSNSRVQQCNHSYSLQKKVVVK